MNSLTLFICRKSRAAIIWITVTSASNLVADNPGLEEVIVTGNNRDGSLDQFRTGQTGISLSGDELRLQISNTLGETLANQPGVHNASFGPSVGLPVLRGLSGVRVRVIEDGIGSWDASSLSPDHAIAIEPVLAERIQVLQGASTIEFGNAAVGGVVAVDTQRIPLRKTGRTLSGSVELRQELLNDHQQTTAVAKLNAENDRVGLHLDAFHREHDDVGIPACAIDTDKVNEQFGFDASQSNTCSYIANSDAQASGFSAGGAVTAQHWHLGTSIRQTRYQYGIPPGSHTEPRDGEHAHAASEADPYIRIGLEQWRYDVTAGIEFDRRFLKQLELLIAHVNYEHLETENGTHGTHFSNDVTELKWRLAHSVAEYSQGVIGLQIIDRHFEAVGIENFVPPSDVDSYGFYLLEKLTFGDWTWQASARYDHTEVSQRAATAPLRPDSRQLMYSPISYETASYQFAAAWTPNDKHKLSLALGRHQRAPDVHELLALGPHLATRSFDIGLLIRSDGELPAAELFHSLELSWDWQHAWGSNSLHWFHSEVDGFIYQANTGFFYDLAEQLFRNNCVRLAECLPVYEYRQSDAVLQGFEWQWLWPQWQLGAGAVQVEWFADFVEGRLRDGAPGRSTATQTSAQAIPRLPPWRLGGGIEWRINDWMLELSGSYVAAQDEPGAFETTTDSYLRVDASVHWVVPGSEGQGTVFLQANNLGGQSIRNATSFIRNFAPEPGRALELGIRWDWQ